MGGTQLQHSPNGELTRDESGNTLIYDAWGRLVKVQSSGGSPISTYEYDALSRRIEAGGTQLIYSAGWQVVEERSASTGAKQAQYLWSPVYVDGMILRDRDSDGNGTLDQRQYALPRA